MGKIERFFDKFKPTFFTVHRFKSFQGNFIQAFYCFLLDRTYQSHRSLGTDADPLGSNIAIDATETIKLTLSNKNYLILLYLLF